MKNIFLYSLIVILVGCTGSPVWHGLKMNQTAKEAEINNRKMMRIEIGQMKEEVLKIMGFPAKREAYQLENNNIVEFLFFRTQGWSQEDGGDADHQFTPVAIQNGKVMGWGRNFYDKVVRTSVEIIRK